MQEATEDVELCDGDFADIPVGGDVRQRACPSSDKEWSIYHNTRKGDVVLLDKDES